MNIRPIPTVFRSEPSPAGPVDRTVEPVLYAGIVARRVAIIALMLLLILPSVWSMVTGQRALLVDSAAKTGESAIAVIVPEVGVPQIGDTVAVRTEAASSVSVGRVADVGRRSIALQDTTRPDSWTAPLAELRGSVLAVFEGPVITLLTSLPPLTMSSAIIVLIIALVALPLRRTEPNERDVVVGVPRAHHIKHFHDVTRA